MNAKQGKRTVLVSIAVVASLAAVSGESRAAAAPSGQALPGSIAYSASSQRGGVPFQVYIARPDGTTVELTHVASHRPFAAWKSWSPDGSRLLVSANDGIYVVRSDGSSETRVSPASSDDIVGASWSPDGRTIGYLVRDRLYVVAADGRSAPRLLAKFVSVWLGSWSWSPDGQRIVFAGENGLYVLNTGGAPRPTKIRLRPRPSIPTGVHASQPPTYNTAVWSPDGSRIAFQWDDGRTQCCRNDWIYVTRPDGTGVTRVHRGSIRAWSPDGRKLAFAEGIINDYSLSVVDADGANLHHLRCEHACGNPSWFPDGSQLAYTTRDGQKIVVSRTEGSGRRTIAGPNVRDSDYVPGGDYSLSPDGSAIAYVAGKGSDRGRGLYVVGTDGSGRRLVVHSTTLRLSGPNWRPTLRGRNPRTTTKGERRA
jgi:Tol biopolymer transport system component